LRYFVQVVESGSISRAAASLHITQPGLSKRVADLERVFNAPLLRRGPVGVVPTEQGRALFIVAKRILQDVTAIAQEVELLSTEPAGTVSIGCPIGSADIIGYPLFKAVRQQLPKVRLVFASGRSREMIRRLGAGDLDATFVSAYKRQPGVTSLPFIREEIFVAATPSLMRRLEGDVVDVRALGTLPLIAPGATSFAIRDMVIEQLPRDLRLNVVAEVDDWGLHRRLLLEGEGYSLSTWALISSEVRAGLLEMRPLGRPQLSRDIALATSVYRPINSATDAVLQLAQRVVADLIASGEWRFAELLQQPPTGASSSTDPIAAQAPDADAAAE
jgi:LysR family nitrogen assimilation transcriptional regulator